jgi:hypothetical protein
MKAVLRVSFTLDGTVALSPKAFPTDDIDVSGDIEILRFANYSQDPEFSMDPELIGTHFGVSMDVWKATDPQAFTIEDLWFNTI